MATDGSGDLIVADKGDGGRIQKRDAAGTWTMIAKTDSAGIAADSSGDLYYLSGSALILKIDPSKNLTVISLDPGRTYGLKSIAVDDAGDLWAADATNYRILQYEERPVAAFLKGDLNGDGRIDIQDASLLLRIVIGSLAPTSAQKAAGDANVDGALNVQDVTALLQAIAGIRKIG